MKSSFGSRDSAIRGSNSLVSVLYCISESKMAIRSAPASVPTVPLTSGSRPGGSFLLANDSSLPATVSVHSSPPAAPPSVVAVSSAAVVAAPPSASVVAGSSPAVVAAPLSVVAASSPAVPAAPSSSSSSPQPTAKSDTAPSSTNAHIRLPISIPLVCHAPYPVAVRPAHCSALLPVGVSTT